MLTQTLRTRLLVNGVAALPVPAEISYDSSDPYAIRVVFHAAGDTVLWVFAREILDAGMRGGAGLGDVKVTPGHGPCGVTYIDLSSPEGEALIEVPTAELAAFLDRTYAEVPAGTECCDTDALIAQIRASA